MNQKTTEHDTDIRNMVFKMHDLELHLMPSAEELQAKYVLSDQFHKSMEQLIWRMRRKERRRRGIRYASGWAAALLLTFCILNMPGMIGACENITEWFEEYAMFHFREQSNSDVLPEYELGYVPEGYVLTESIYTKHNGCIQYISGNQSLTLTYVHDSARCNVDIKHRNHEEIMLDSNTLIYYFAAEANTESSIIWYSEDEEICFTLTGSLPLEELLQVQEKIVEKN
ncbi:MAG: DUF4367 domain-containing protein [Lachnospiraceae bacterium]|nr:DUF4367 domain-containing protein [Lachnospiraceae bacterium]